MTTDTFTFQRDFPLPPDRMFTLMTASEYREIWGAPDDNQVLETLSSDMRVGGVEQHRCGPADNPMFEATTRWYHIDAPASAVFTETINAEGMDVGASLVTYQIDAADTGSHVTITVAVSSFVGPEMMAEFEGGWAGSFEKLAELAAKS